ncbi:MAG: MotA/TolQ/ExbB proton channel family protein [Bacteroidales bacterium]|nr:MotA/TolQ/ExbB proton channel family protein [Bacteroidales bacterium]
MKKAFALMSIFGLLAFTNLNGLKAQDAPAPAEAAPATEQVDEQTADSAAPAEAINAEEAEVETVAAAPAKKDTFHQVLKKKFIEGGAGWMTPVLLCLILGLALVIERILYLNMSSTNVTKLLNGIEDNVKNGNYEGAKELCRNTRGPVASIFYQGLDRIDTGLENVEKSITSYGGVQMARLEANMTWIAMFIALAPSFGFLGTTVGMVGAFDAIEAAGDISPTVVAGGMKVALLTTIFGLIVAIILQIFYNYLLTKIESLVSDMEEGSISFMDILVKYHK